MAATILRGVSVRKWFKGLLAIDATMTAGFMARKSASDRLLFSPHLVARVIRTEGTAF